MPIARMAMVKMARMAALAATLFLVTVAPAHAAFSPDLTVGVTPATVQVGPLLDAVITQPFTDTPVERFTLTLPAGFTLASAPGAASCDPALLPAGACPADTAIGT